MVCTDSPLSSSSDRVGPNSVRTQSESARPSRRYRTSHINLSWHPILRRCPWSLQWPVCSLISIDEIIRDDMLQLGIVVCEANISRYCELSSDSMNSLCHISSQCLQISDLISLVDSGIFSTSRAEVRRAAILAS